MSIYRNNFFSTRASSEHGQDTRPRANVHNDFILEQVTIVIDRITVGHCADFIFKHFL